MPTVLTLQLQLPEIVAQQIEKEIRFDRMRESNKELFLHLFFFFFLKVCRFASKVFPQERKKDQKSEKSQALWKFMLVHHLRTNNVDKHFP